MHPHVFGQERDEWCHEFVSTLEAFVKRQVGRLLVDRIGRLPEAAAVAPDVPVAELINE
jgi:hypothetical protein